jgi:hypothetical protein
LPKDFSDSLKARLRDYCPDQQVDSETPWEDPADTFVSHVLAAARGAVSDLHWQQLDLTKSEIRAEQLDLFKRLNDLHHKLRNLSRDFERLLPIGADPLGCADKLKELIGYVEGSGQNIDKLADARRPAEKQHDVAVEMAVRVLRVLKGYGIAVSATGGIGNVDSDYTSDAVQILRIIGADIGLVFADLTWRDKIIEAKKSAPDL